jgi:hypothetical protein
LAFPSHLPSDPPLDSQPARRQAAVPSPTSAGAARWLLALTWIAIALSGWRLGSLCARSTSVLDADEAVHAVEALRLYDSLEHEGARDFLAKLYFPERWQAPVQDHLRWYPPVHSLLVLPSLALLGRSDFAVRVPSVVLLCLSALLFHALARRLAPRAPDWAGLLAVLLLLSSPNVLTFSVQCLIEPASLAALALALLLYLRSLERDHPLGRASLAGAGLALAFLTKYDHGALLGLALGLAELARARARPRALLRPVALLFAIPALAGALWLAHPDKLTAFFDAAAHPFYGSPRLIALNLAATWFLEHTAAPALALIVLVTPFWALGRARSTALRILAFFALFGALALASRARFLFRYSYGVAPFWLLLAGACAPALLTACAARLQRSSARARVCIGGTALALGLAFALVPARVLADPIELRASLAELLARVFALRADRFGLALEPAAYAEPLAEGLARAHVLLRHGIQDGGALLALFGLLLLASVRGWCRTPSAAALALLLVAASLRGTLSWAVHLPRLVEWEYEGPGELRALSRLVEQHAPERGTILLAGGWDQYANNTLRWELACLRPRARYDALDVRGDMIGSLVLPEAPRIAWWTNELANAPHERLPELVVLLDAHEDFAYSMERGSELELYAQVLARRGGWQRVAAEDFPHLGLSAELHALARSSAPLDPPLRLAPEDVPAGRAVGRAGWLIKDDSWRALRAPWVARELHGERAR